MSEVITIPFSEPDTTVAAGQGAILEEQINFNGKVRFIALAFPDGCNSLVRIVCKVNNEQILPSKGYIAFNNFTKDFPINKLVSAGSYLVVEIRNTDPLNAHTPSVIWSVEKEPERIL